MTVSLKKSTLYGTMVMGGANISIRIVTMVSSVWLMNRLEVADFGVVAGAMIVLYTTNLFAGLGLSFAVIQSQADRGKVAYQSFIVTASLGILLCAGIMLNVDTFAALLGKPAVAPLLRWLAPLVFFGGLSMVPEALMQKQMLFNRFSVIVMVAELTYVGLALTFAYSGFGLWSLVYAALGKSFLTFVLDWIGTPGWEWITPKPWDRKLMRDLLSFGLRSTGGGLTTYIYSLIDVVSITRWLGLTQLSYYQRSADFTSRTVDSLNGVLSAVLLPSYAQIQSDRERLARAYLKSLRLISFIIVPVTAGMMVMAPEMVATFLDPEWAPMVGPFQILCLAGMVKPLSATTSVLFTSTGHPGFNFRAGLVVIIALIPGVVLLMPGYGIVGVAVAVLFAQLAGFVFNLLQMRKIIKDAAAGMLPAIVPALIASAAMFCAVLLGKAALTAAGMNLNVPGSVVALVSLGAIVYVISLYMMQRALVREIADLMLTRFRSKSATTTERAEGHSA
jgi:PST family polysaccharide transporter